MNNKNNIDYIKEKSGWDSEYRNSTFLSHSIEPLLEVKKFLKYCHKHIENSLEGILLDIGCGNGRHAIYASQHYGMFGMGYDISPYAIKEAINNLNHTKKSSCSFDVWNVRTKIPVNNATVSVALDVTCSPSIVMADIENFWREVSRTVKHGGIIFSRQLIIDNDSNAKELLKKSPFENEYIHPTLNHLERVEYFDPITERFERYFEVLFKEKTQGYQTVDGIKYKRSYGIWYLKKK